MSGEITSSSLQSDSIRMTLFLSETLPQYLSENSSLAMLDMSGSEQKEFVLNIAAARTPDFGEMLKAFGFKD